MSAPNPEPRTQNRGTALLELAIFGMVAMAALGLLIRIGLQANFDQEVRMGAFRRALAAAAADDEAGQGNTQDALSVSYYYMLDRQMPNPGEGFLGLSRSRSHASAFVERGRWLTFGFEDQPGGDPEAGRRTHPRVIVRLNEVEERYRDNDFPCGTGTAVPCHDVPNPGNIEVDAQRAVVREQWIINEHAGSVQQRETFSTASPGVTTRSGAVINLRENAGSTTQNGAHPGCGEEGVLCSTLGPPPSVTWSH